MSVEPLSTTMTSYSPSGVCWASDSRQRRVRSARLNTGMMMEAGVPSMFSHGMVMS